jgi:hypothetical protein
MARILTQAELNQLTNPQIKEELKKRGIGGYTGLKRDDLIAYYLNPPPKESQRSPGRPKGLGASKTPTTVNIFPSTLVSTIAPMPPTVPIVPLVQPTISTTIIPTVPAVPTVPTVPVTEETLTWTSDNLYKINLIPLKKLLKDLGVAGYSGKSKPEVIKALLEHPPANNLVLELDTGRRITFLAPRGQHVSLINTIPTVPIMPTIPPMAPVVPQIPSSMAPIVSISPMVPTVPIVPIVPIVPTIPTQRSPRQPSVIFAPVTKKLEEVRMIASPPEEFDIGGVLYSLAQPNIGDIVYLDSYPGHRDYLVTSSEKDPSGSYVEYVTLTPVIKTDKEKLTAFIDTAGKTLRAKLDLYGVPSWKLLSGEAVNFQWGLASV